MLLKIIKIFSVTNNYFTVCSVSRIYNKNEFIFLKEASDGILFLIGPLKRYNLQNIPIH